MDYLDEVMNPERQCPCGLSGSPGHVRAHQRKCLVYEQAQEIAALRAERQALAKAARELLAVPWPRLGGLSETEKFVRRAAEGDS